MGKKSRCRKRSNKKASYNKIKLFTSHYNAEIEQNLRSSGNCLASRLSLGPEKSSSSFSKVHKLVKIRTSAKDRISYVKKPSSPSFQVANKYSSDIKLQSEDINESTRSSWYYHLYADVKIPQICAYSISNRCSFEQIGCQRLHAKCAAHWQFHYKDHWYNFREFHSKVLEKAFQDPNIDLVQIKSLDPKLLDKDSRGLIDVLGTNSYVADFLEMKLSCLDSSFPMRRLSTLSSAISNSSIATIYNWYFEDDNYNWIKFGQSVSKALIESVPKVTSEYIEKLFCNKLPIAYTSNRYKYEIDPTNMTQKNIETKTVRAVKRRPKKRLIKETGVNSNVDAPVACQSRKTCLIKSEPNTYDFVYVSHLILSKLPNINITNIQKIQNFFLQEAYKNKKKQILAKNKQSTLNEKLLFHATKSRNIRSIIEENLDWRLNGTNVGNRYGKGTYFSSLANKCLRYCDKDSAEKVMLVVRVLVGTYTLGDQSMVKPPINPVNGRMFDTTVNCMKNPTTFVKYDSQEYYPEYLVEFKLEQ